MTSPGRSEYTLTVVVGKTLILTTVSAVGTGGEPINLDGTAKKPSTVALPRTCMQGSWGSNRRRDVAQCKTSARYMLYKPIGTRSCPALAIPFHEQSSTVYTTHRAEPEGHVAAYDMSACNHRRANVQYRRVGKQAGKTIRTLSQALTSRQHVVLSSKGKRWCIIRVCDSAMYDEHRHLDIRWQ